MSNILGHENTPVGAEEVEEVGEETKYLFACDNYPTFKTKLADGTRIQFKNRIFKTNDPAMARALLDLMSRSNAVNSAIRVIDVDAQRRLAEQDMANRRDLAIKGTTHSSAMRLDARDEALDELRKDPQKAKDLQEQIVKDDLELTQSINRAQKEGNQPQPGASLEEGSGFVPLEDEKKALEPLPEIVEKPAREGTAPLAKPADPSGTVNSILGIAAKAAS